MRFPQSLCSLFEVPTVARSSLFFYCSLRHVSEKDIAVGFSVVGVRARVLSFRGKVFAFSRVETDGADSVDFSIRSGLISLFWVLSMRLWV